MDKLNIPRPTGGATGACAPDVRGDISAHLIASLTRLAYDTYGESGGVGERFCNEVTKLSRGSIRLLLWDQRAERAALAAAPIVRLKMPVAYRGISYGELFVACDPLRSTHPALSLDASARLAEACGWLLHVLEEGALLNRQCQHIETAHAATLSRSQLDVLRYMAMGKNTEAIADALHITPATVATHRRAIYARLGVHGPMEAVLAGHRLGLVYLISTPSPSAIPLRRQK